MTASGLAEVDKPKLGCAILGLLIHTILRHEQNMNNGLTFNFSGVIFTALPSGALWRPDEGLLVVSDLVWKIRSHGRCR